jgi:hypothetical protein
VFSGLHEQGYSLHGLDPNFGSFVANYGSPVASVRRTSDAAAVATVEKTAWKSHTVALLQVAGVSKLKNVTAVQQIKTTQILLCYGLLCFTS